MNYGGSTQRLFKAAILAMISFFLITDSSLAIHETGPAIEFEKSTHHFGDLYQNETRSCAFRFKNVGNQPLKILSVEGT
jgi:hypothetical protein